MNYIISSKDFPIIIVYLVYFVYFFGTFYIVLRLMYDDKKHKTI